MKVKCINDDWSNVLPNTIAAYVLKVGDPMPEKGKEYEVIGVSEAGYELGGLDFSAYPGGRMLFKKERFEISDDTFVPNAVYNGTPVRMVNMYFSLSFPKSAMGKMPRKMKKRFKKHGFLFTHPAHKLVSPIR